MKTFTTFLQEKNYKEKTISNMEESVERFFSWTEKHRIQPQTATYDNLLEFVRFSRESGNKPVTINKKLVNLRTWFDWLISTGQIKTNPALDLKVKAPSKTLKTGLLNEEQLQKLYDSYPSGNPVDKRNKIMVGFLVFQGLTTKEILALRAEDVDVKNATVRIRENTVSRGRTLKLESVQIAELYEYLFVSRPERMKRSQTEPEQLFLGLTKGADATPSFQHITGKIKKLNRNFQGATHIRASVISNWLKRYNLRQVQYMAGHKKVQATEVYKTQSLDKLKTEIETFHPLKTVLS